MKNEELLEQIYESNLNRIKELLGEGADINYIDKNMDSPLLMAISNNNYTLVKFLLENGANPNPDPDKVYTLPLNLAIDVAVETTKNNINETKDSTDIIKLLLEFGANLNIKDRDGKNAYEFAKGYHIPAQKLFESVIKNNKNNN